MSMPTDTQSADSRFALKKKEDKPKDILALLQSDSVKRKVELALPRHMRADRMLRVMLTAVSSNPKLKACTQTSLLSCLMKCSAYGLEPDGRHAHLIPFKEECTLIFDYKGLVSLVRRSGDVKTIHADVVYEADEFDYNYGSGAHLRHKPSLDPKRRDGEMLCAYSFVVMSTGEESFEVVSLDEILSVRDNSQGYRAFKSGYTKSNPWDTNFDEMAKKTAFRRHTKWLPLSFELAEAVNGDDDRALEEKRFAAAKPVTPTDLDAPRIELQIEDDLEGGAENGATTEAVDSASVAEPKEKTTEKKEPAKPKSEKPKGSPIEQLKAMMTVDGFSDAEVIEYLVRKHNHPGCPKVEELGATAIGWAIQNWEIISAQIRIDRQSNEQAQ